MFLAILSYQERFNILVRSTSPSGGVAPLQLWRLAQIQGSSAQFMCRAIERTSYDGNINS